MNKTNKELAVEIALKYIEATAIPGNRVEVVKPDTLMSRVS